MRGLAASGAPGAQDAIARGADGCAPPRPGRRMGRILRQLRARPLSARAELRLANGLGDPGIAGGGPRRRGREQRRPVPAGTQRADGTWPEEASTGTGFPNVFYLTYGMYRDYFLCWR